MRRSSRILLLSLALSLGAAACQSTGPDWGTPASAKSTPNPVPAGQNLAAIQAVYSDRCARCHGDTGAGDGPDASLYKPLPSSLTSDTARQESDGELFWKISKGRRPMPSYENELSAEQRWELVNLLRTFPAKPAATDPSPAAK